MDRDSADRIFAEGSNDHSYHQNESILMEEVLRGEIAKLKEQQKRLFSVVEKIHRGQTNPTLISQRSTSSASFWIEPEKICSNCSQLESGASSPTSLSRSVSSLSLVSLQSQSSSEESPETGTQHSEDTASVLECPAQEIISSMWDDFSVDSYANELEDDFNQRRVEQKVPTKEWRPRITIPEPFIMTIRDENRVRKKSRAMQLAEEEKQRKEEQEEAECSMQFKANPMPASTYLPLYEIIVAKNEYRRKKVKENSKELLKSQEKPFKFVERENKKRLRKQDISLKKKQERETDSRPFRAKPVPTYLFDTSIEDKIKEEEEYRKIRVKMRAEDLLRQSRLPGTMGERARSKTTPSAAQRQDLLEQSPTHQPDINKGVPNFTSSHVILQKELTNRKCAKTSTEVKPFLLKTEMIPSRKERVQQDIMLDEATLPESRWPYVTPRRKVYSVCQRLRSAPTSDPQKTHTTILRETMTKEKLDAVLALEENEEERKKRKEERERELKNELSRKMKKYSTDKTRQALSREQKTKAVQ